MCEEEKPRPKIKVQLVNDAETFVEFSDWFDFADWLREREGFETTIVGWTYLHEH